VQKVELLVQLTQWLGSKRKPSELPAGHVATVCVR